MRWTRAAAIWAVAGVLGAAYALDSTPPPETRPPGRMPATAAVPPGRIAYRVDPQTVRSVELHRGAEIVAWERSGPAGWRVIKPEGHGVPGGLLDAFVEQLAENGLGERIEGNPADDAFGLGQPSFVVVTEAANGQKLTLTVGSRTPTGTAAYARRDEDSSVLLVGRNLVYYADLVFDAAR
jgi:Domain of unknown function (DUF4340)